VSGQPRCRPKVNMHPLGANQVLSNNSQEIFSAQLDVYVRIVWRGASMEDNVSEMRVNLCQGNHQESPNAIAAGYYSRYNPDSNVLTNVLTNVSTINIIVTTKFLRASPGRAKARGYSRLETISKCSAPSEKIAFDSRNRKKSEEIGHAAEGT